ncbi:MAG: putative membrane protein YphA (DoxX/SURF4 family) [Planctomycetota bacterium]|jgi:uncharacterized membrane protein YphA (DoxX/SURF4 family)
MSAPACSTTESSGAAELVLRFVTALTCVTAAWLAWARPTTVNSQLFMELDVSSELAGTIDRTAAFLLLLVAAAVLFTRSRLACAFATTWLLALALAKAASGGEFFSEFAPLASAVRFGAPVALLLIWSRRDSAAFWVLRVCVAVTFVAHGLEALAHAPGFIDLILLSARRFLDLRISEAAACHALTVIGVVDIVAAILILAQRWRSVAGYMTIWGLATLTSRMTAMGFERWPEAATRIANAGVPLAILLEWRAAFRAPTN